MSEEIVKKLKKITQTIGSVKVEYISGDGGTLCSGCGYIFDGEYIYGGYIEMQGYVAANGNVFCDDCIYYLKKSGIRRSETCKTCGVFFHSRNTLFKHLDEYKFHMYNINFIPPYTDEDGSDVEDDEEETCEVSRDNIIPIEEPIKVTQLYFQIHMKNKHMNRK